MYLIDTNVLSELRKRSRADEGVIDWFSQTRPQLHFVSVLTVFELERGVQLIERRDARQGVTLRKWLEQIIIEYEERTLVVDPQTARLCASMHIPNKRPLSDSLIAATAIISGKTILTRNTVDFADLGALVINPFAADA